MLDALTFDAGSTLTPDQHADARQQGYYRQYQRPSDEHDPDGLTGALRLTSLILN
ncbi:hypothetical protein ABH546_17790 [Escherichia coli]